MNQQQLARLERFINEEFPTKLADGEYYSVEEECFCVIGAMMKNIEPNFGMEVVGDFWFNGETITNLINNTVKRADKNLENPAMTQLANKLIEEFGLTNEELASIQEANDGFRWETGEERAQEVKQFLMKLVASKKEELAE
jgi:arginyl-tRNA synthetase